MKKRMSLRRFVQNRRFFVQLLAALIMLSLFPSLIFNGYFLHRIKHDMAMQAQALAESCLDAFAGYFASALQNAQQLLYHLLTDMGTLFKVNSLSALRVLEKMDLLNSMNILSATIGDYTRICLYDTRSDVVFASNYGVTDMKNPRFAWLREQVALATQQRMVRVTNPVLLDEVARSGAYYYCAVIQPPVRHVAGIFLFDVEHMMENYRASAGIAREMYTISLVDDAGTVIYMLGEAAEVAGDALRVSRSVGGTRLHIVADIQIRQLFAKLDATARSITMISLVLMAVVVVLAFALAGTLYRPVRRLVDDIGEGMRSAAGEFFFIRTSYLRLQDRFYRAVNNMEEARRKLLRAQMAAGLRGTPPAIISSEGQHYYVLIIRAKEHFLPAHLEEQLEQAVGEGELFHDGADYVYVFTREQNTGAVVEILDKTLDIRRFSLALADKARPLHELYQSRAEASLAQAVAMSANLSYTATWHAIQALACKQDQYAAVLAKIPEMASETLDVVEAWLSANLTEEEYGWRMFIAVTAICEACESKPDILFEAATGLYKAAGDKTRRKAHRLLNRLARQAAALQSQQEGQSKTSEVLLKAIDEYIAANFHIQFSLEDIAEAVGATRQRVGDVIKDAHQMTFVNYLNQYRIEQAKALLTDTDFRLDRVSAATGFSSSSYFIRVFKRITGLTPGEYRESTIDKEECNHEAHPGI